MVQKGQRDKAIGLLKKKRYKESLLAKTDSQISNLEEMVQSIEFTVMSTAFLEGIKAGNKALAALKAEIGSTDEVTEIMDEMRDGIAWSNEVTEILAGKLTTADDQAIKDEFEALEKLYPSEDALAASTSLPNVPAFEPLPSVPVADPPPGVTIAREAAQILAD